MNKTEFINEIKQFKTSKNNDVEAKELIALYPYFTLAQLIQAKKDPSHLFNLNVLYPDRHYLKTLLTNKKIKEKPVVKEEVKQDSQDAQLILQQRLNELHKPLQEEENSEQLPNDEDVSLDELIEKFNSNHPKIACTFDDSEEDEMYEDLCKNSVSEKMNIISETLANIYKEQGSYDKAIKIYKALIVKYPEKSSTFANLIEELKEIKNNQKI
jgi:hypothetical protein